MLDLIGKGLGARAWGLETHGPDLAEGPLGGVPEDGAGQGVEEAALRESPWAPPPVVGRSRRPSGILSSVHAAC